MKRLLKFRKKINKTVKRITKNLETKGLFETISYELYEGKTNIAPKVCKWQLRTLKKTINKRANDIT